MSEVIDCSREPLSSWHPSLADMLADDWMIVE